MNKNQIKGYATKAKGTVKEIAGKVTGNKSVEYMGKAEKHVGEAEARYGNLKSDVTKTKK